MTDRVCACGCGASMNGARSQARYASSACRSKAWKERNGYRDPRTRTERAGKPSRSGSQRKREGLSVYFARPEDAALAAMYITVGGGMDSAPYAALAKAIDRRKAR